MGARVLAIGRGVLCTIHHGNLLHALLPNGSVLVYSKYLSEPLFERITCREIEVVATHNEKRVALDEFKDAPLTSGA